MAKLQGNRNYYTMMEIQNRTASKKGNLTHCKMSSPLSSDPEILFSTFLSKIHRHKREDIHWGKRKASIKGQENSW
jgi:hypothetical protein